MKKYEAVVKLSTGEVVVYHNINTGLFKFHKFICEKFNKEQKWKYYKVRRIKNKEIIGTFYNEKLENYFLFLLRGMDILSIGIYSLQRHKFWRRVKTFFLS